jgi:hypothetical protein
MITYKESKIAAAEMQFVLSRDSEGELKPQECYTRLVNNRYLGADGLIPLGDTYVNFTEIPVEIIAQLDAALVALYEHAAHLAKLKQKSELQSGDLLVNGFKFEEPVTQTPEEE